MLRPTSLWRWGRRGAFDMASLGGTGASRIILTPPPRASSALASVQEKIAAPIAMRVAAEMTNAFFMLHLPSAIWLLYMYTCVERSHCHEHNGSRGNQHL